MRKVKLFLFSGAGVLLLVACSQTPDANSLASATSVAEAGKTIASTMNAAVEGKALRLTGTSQGNGKGANKTEATLLINPDMSSQLVETKSDAEGNSQTIVTQCAPAGNCAMQLLREDGTKSEWFTLKDYDMDIPAPERRSFDSYTDIEGNSAQVGWKWKLEEGALIGDNSKGSTLQIELDGQTLTQKETYPSNSTFASRTMVIDTVAPEVLESPAGAKELTSWPE